MANPRQFRGKTASSVGTALAGAVGNIESLRREHSEMGSVIDLARDLDQMTNNLKFRMEGVYSELFGPRISEVHDTGANAMPCGQVNQIAMYLRDARSTLEQFDELVRLYEERTGLVADRGPFVQDTVKAARG